MSTRKKPQSRRPTATVRTVGPNGPDLAALLASFLPARCPECATDHLHDLTLGHVTHDGGADLRPAQRKTAIDHLSAGDAGDTLFRVCCGCDYSAVIVSEWY